MASFIERLISDDFVWNAITNSLPSRRRNKRSTIEICCPMCVRRGESADKRFRCGITRTNEIKIHCFNCGFAAKYVSGTLLSKSLQSFLVELGMSDTDVKRLNHKAMQYRSMFESSPEAMALLPETFVPNFESRSLPPGSKTLEAWAAHYATTEPDPNFMEVVEYLYSRGDEIATAATYYWTPEPGKHLMNRRVIIPLTHMGQTVGYTSRHIDPDSSQRYHMEVGPNYIYNARTFGLSDRKYILLCEGIFDAIAIDAAGTLGSRLNAQQIAWINSYGKIPILVPDRDRRGNALIDVALEQKWHVAFPAFREENATMNWWEYDVKDPAEAVKRYGRIWTILSIIQSATKNPAKIAQQRKLLY